MGSESAPEPSAISRRLRTQQAEFGASLLCIGDELLDGSVEDRIVPLVASRLCTLGVELDSVHVVPDRIASISELLRFELGRQRPRLVLTSGGLGPTHDDITYKAISTTTGRPLVRSDLVASRISAAVGQDCTDSSDASLARMLSMADIPRGSHVIGRGGWLTVVVVDVDGGLRVNRGAEIVPLPGVPSHFQQAFEKIVLPFLPVHETPAGGAKLQVSIRHESPEALIADLLENLSTARPSVDVRSLPGEPSVVQVQGPTDDVEAVTRSLMECLADVCSRRGR